MVKKVVIAAAGKGTRMLALSGDKPKHLIEVNGRPFLSYILDNLSLAGYTDIILVGGYKQALMEDFEKKYVAPNGGELKLKFINQFEILDPEEKYGTACPLMCLKDINEQFLYICGDNFYSVEDLRAMNVDDDYNYVAGLKTENPENFGALITEGEFLKEIIEKPKELVSDLINVSLYKFTPEIFKEVLEIKKSSRGEYEITDAVSLLAKERKVKVKKISDFWMDFGQPEDIQKMENFLNKK